MIITARILLNIREAALGRGESGFSTIEPSAVGTAEGPHSFSLASEVEA